MKRIFVGALMLGMVSSCGHEKITSGPESEVKIYGGSKVATSDAIARFTVVLMQNDRTVCTGVLIAPRVVVSAAHCYFLFEPSRPIYAGFGLSDKAAAKIPVEDFAYHADFDAVAGKQGSTERAANDVSLLKLASPAPSPYSPVAIMQATDEVALGESVTLAGFGKTDVKSGWFSTVVGELYKVDTKIVLEAPAAKEIWFGDTPGRAPCNGDSGGPALVLRSGQYKLLGVTSRGRNCATDFIYTDLRYFQSWMASTTTAFGL